MKIDRIILNNFRIYRGENEIIFNDKKNRNVSLIAGKNGFGKTTFLTSLIWAFYGGLMGQVEEKYKRDIKTSGGYDNFLNTLINKNVFRDYESGDNDKPSFSVEVHLVDVVIPSIPCKKVIIKRKVNAINNKETLQILIDGHENELTKEVGYEVFINDFILPREIAKFFFFDAEKIVTLAEAKSKDELRSLSKAYSEVLGIKKYEDLKSNLNNLLTKLRRSGVSKVDEVKLKELETKESELNDLISLNEERQEQIREEQKKIQLELDALQENLIREGNEVTVEQLKEYHSERKVLQGELDEVRSNLKNFYEILPFVIAGKRFEELIEQVNLETSLKTKGLNQDVLKDEIQQFTSDLVSELKNLKLWKEHFKAVDASINKIIEERFKDEQSTSGKVLLDYTDEQYRQIVANYEYIKNSFAHQFNVIVKQEKDLKLKVSRISKKIKQGEARKDNEQAKLLHDKRIEFNSKNEEFGAEVESLIEELGALKHQLASNNKVLSEYRKNYTLVETDKKKYDVTVDLLNKLNDLTVRIKEEKKYSLQKAIILGLRKLMHKNDFINNVNVRIEDDVMDIDLLDANNKVIDKDTLSKGEQQLYATALLKALVDESGIDFPVFIDSPLQKFDKEHSSNVIQQFYPSISDQVVLFPLLEKELSIPEYKKMEPNLNGVYLIENNKKGSYIEQHKIKELFTQFNKQNHVLEH